MHHVASYKPFGMSILTSAQNMRFLGSLTIHHDSTMSGCGDAVQDLDSLLGYLLAAADGSLEDQLHHIAELAVTSYQIPFDPEILHARSHVMPPIIYDVCIYAHKMVINKWLC